MKLQLKRSPYLHLLTDPQFKLWIENVERGSTITAAEYWRRMGRITKELDLTTEQLAKMSEKQAGDFLLRMISHWEAKGGLGTNIKNYTKPLKSWWAFNDITVRRKIKIQGANDYVKYENERIPTKEELSKMLNVGDLRAKVAMSLMAFSGTRIEVLGSYRATDGLRVSDLPDLVVKKDKVDFKKVPTIIVVRKTLSKSRIKYFTFLPDQGCQYLMEYLEYRIRAGERIGADSPVITSSSFNPGFVGKHISTTNVSDMMRKPIRGAGFEWRPYVLRRYFDTNMMVAENEGMIIRDWRQFFMGHQGDIEAVYTVNKGLRDSDVDKMREAYGKAAEKHLVTIREQSLTEDRLAEEFNRRFLLISEFTEDDIRAMGDISKLAPQQLHDLASRRRMEEMGLRNGNRQKVVRMEEVKGMIMEGWEFVQQLPTNEAIVRLPSGR